MPAVHPAHRKWKSPEKDLLKQLSKHHAIQSREAGSIVRETFSTPWTDVDIRNARARVRREELGGYSPTQALIKAFDDNQVNYVKRMNEDDEVVALFWTYDWCIDMWKRYPTVLSMDNTYNTNRFKMPLFNITGITNLHTTFNIGFGLVDNERAEGFMWLTEAMDTIRRRHAISTPQVCLTDFEINLRDALITTYPDTRLQICIFHINANVVLNVKKKWKNPPEADDEEADAVAFVREDDDPAPDLSDNTDLQDLNAPASDEATGPGTNPGESAITMPAIDQHIPHDKNGVFIL